MSSKARNAIRHLTPELERSIGQNPLLSIDTFLIPSPYIRDSGIAKDYEHSYVWVQEGEILGYIMVYSDPSQECFLIYKLVTSPFVRGAGIGTALGGHLVASIPREASVYLYVWEKQTDSLEFFLNKGFHLGESLVYRNLIFHHLWAQASEILFKQKEEDETGPDKREEIGRTRHDARKTIRFLSHMVDILSLDNCGRIIEDINRETTTLVNTLNSFRDSMSRVHEVNITELILERIVPYVGGSSIPCELRLKLQKTNQVVLGNYVDVSRAFINIVANSLESIAASNRETGIMEIKIGEDQGTPYVRFRDNGVGMDAARLERGPDGIPLFVGKSTKARNEGEGLGTVQIFSTFGPENITVDARPNRGCTWKISFGEPLLRSDPWYARLERRFLEASHLQQSRPLTASSSRQEIIAYIWQTRKIEIFLFDVILHFSAHQNIRTIFRSIFGYLVGETPESQLKKYIGSLRVDRPVMKDWLLEISQRVRSRWILIGAAGEGTPLSDAMLKSYGQAVDNVIIFTLNPRTGAFYATDRKLAEHLDFAPYLGAEREGLLRGEFIGDVNSTERPIFLGVWSVDSQEDLLRKLLLLQEGARSLIRIGIDQKKPLAFYQTTWIRHSRDIDSDAVTTFGAFADLPRQELLQFSREADDEIQGFILGRE
ncbi:Histidine kinase-, DNA gyrase B-, and HSP90-like ATPase [Alkalispirochaeta americana]|uniref:Histidine kinase-, DNA gyrase B-, and HSP90-like ATPase n=1 Tax=Alkalispirochaeta americana TaxID=159291 RepID=A0A1N6PVW6_9SPIO|nr:GNAT family N-acetyltransferase [Alkalispirochaeta americana]SIQ08528.1 Histidine kinase-, DNA gyrase B-, and HSP90-like ATPase [Alkalispirochaeta americana]